ncbi:MAG: NAD-dependent epimerase/dehydratase family protein [Candidatus Helarchaeota archaeon]
MIVAITGINSGLGKALVPKLLREPSVEKIIGIDINPLEENTEKIEIYQVDVRNYEGIRNALNAVDVLIHLAFIVVPKKLPKQRVIYDINVNGSKTVFSAAAEQGVQKIIYLSSQSVYGHVKDCPRIVTEDAPRLGIKTTNFYYSHTKALVEEFLDEFEETYPDIVVVRFRPPIIAGPHFTENFNIFLGKKHWNSISPEKGKEKLGLQLIHEDDLTDVLTYAITRNLRGAYNIASNVIEDIDDFIATEFHLKIRHFPRFLVKLGVRFGRLWTKLQWLQAVLYQSLLNTDKISKILNWKPRYSTEDCLRELFISKSNGNRI